MVSETMLALGTTRSCIRELFEYGNRQAAVKTYMGLGLQGYVEAMRFLKGYLER